MNSNNFLALPAEILHNICSLLSDTHKPSLTSLSLVDIRSCTFATAWIFRHVNLEIRGSQSLSRNLVSLLSILQRRQAFGSVHRITVSGFVKIYSDSEVEPPSPDWQLNDANDATYSAHNEIYGTDPFDTRFFPRRSATAERLAPVWQPLVSLIQKAENLKYLDYNCSNPVPLNIIHALEQFQPECRLHVQEFQYRNLSNEMRLPTEIGLIKSPVLHSIKVCYVHRDVDGIDNYNREAVMRTIRGVIPNLKCVELVQCYAPSSRALHMRMGEPKPRWKGFRTDIGPDHPASLDKFACNENLMPLNLREFANALNFNNLQHLELNQPMSDFALRYFTHQIKFHRLHTLTMVLSKHSSDESMLEPNIPSANPAAFLSSLAPLRSLDIIGFLAEDTFGAILSHHGSRLRDLKIVPNIATYWRTGTFQRSCLSLDDFEELAYSCSHLENLQIPVQRSKSKGEEVKCYQILSLCKSLRNLFIELKCDQPTAVPNGHYLVPNGQTVAATDDDSDAESSDEAAYTGSRRPLDWGYSPPGPNIAHIKRALQNCALDETLARSIWKLIAGRKQGLPLHSLKLYPVGATNMGSNDGFQYVREKRIRVLNRAFLLQKSPRDDASVDDVQITELGKHAREAHILRGREEDRSKYFVSKEEDLVEKAFRRIWPERRAGSIDWRDDWHSLPLVSDASN